MFLGRTLLPDEIFMQSFCLLTRMPSAASSPPGAWQLAPAMLAPSKNTPWALDRTHPLS